MKIKSPVLYHKQILPFIISFEHDNNVLSGFFYITENLTINAEEMLFNRIDEMPVEERTYNFSDEFIQEMYNSAESMVLQKIKMFDNKE